MSGGFRRNHNEEIRLARLCGEAVGRKLDFPADFDTIVMFICGSWCLFGNCKSRNINHTRELKSVKERDDISDPENRLETSCYSSRPRRYLGPVATELNFGMDLSLHYLQILHPAIRALKL